MSYLMESSAEGERLARQEAANPSRLRLLAAGLSPGMRALDAGCGSGTVSQLMASLIGPLGHLTAMEPNAARLAEARARLTGLDNVVLSGAALPSTSLERDQFDFVYSQFVFEYFPQPRPALEELVRVTRPGGTVVVADVDGNGLLNWPMPPEVEAGAARVVRALGRAGFDPYAGRKMFTLFSEVGLRDVRVHLEPAFMVAGAADARLIEDWRLRFEALTPLAAPEFESADAWARFQAAYMQMLGDPHALKYGVLLTTVGTRAT